MARRLSEPQTGSSDWKARPMTARRLCHHVPPVARDCALHTDGSIPARHCRPGIGENRRPWSRSSTRAPATRAASTGPATAPDHPAVPDHEPDHDADEPDHDADGPDHDADGPDHGSGHGRSACWRPAPAARVPGVPRGSLPGGCLLRWRGRRLGQVRVAVSPPGRSACCAPKPLAAGEESRSATVGSTRRPPTSSAPRTGPSTLTFGARSPCAARMWARGRRAPPRSWDSPDSSSNSWRN